MTEKSILVVEDDTTLSSVLEYNLKKEGYSVTLAADGAVGLESARSIKPSLILLDVMLPKMNGFEVCRILRQEMTVPILFLTAKEDEIDKVVGLDLGADDYMTKPFQMRELLARVRALFRRSEIAAVKPAESDSIIKIKDLEIDVSRHTAMQKGKVLDLTPKEFSLITFLAKNRGIVFNREQLLEKVWGYDFPGDTRTIDVHMRWLREKIEDDPQAPKILVTIRNVGYKMEE